MATAVGIRELRDRLSHYLDLVKAGEPITVTEHGREIARISPSGESETMRKLREMAARGEVIWSGQRLESLPPPVKAAGGRPLSEIVIEDRG